MYHFDDVERIGNDRLSAVGEWHNVGGAKGIIERAEEKRLRHSSLDFVV